MHYSWYWQTLQYMYIFCTQGVDALNITQIPDSGSLSSILPSHSQAINVLFLLLTVIMIYEYPLYCWSRSVIHHTDSLRLVHCPVFLPVHSLDINVLLLILTVNIIYVYSLHFWSRFNIYYSDSLRLVHCQACCHHTAKLFMYYSLYWESL